MIYWQDHKLSIFYLEVCHANRDETQAEDSGTLHLMLVPNYATVQVVGEKVLVILHSSI